MKRTLALGATAVVMVTGLGRALESGPVEAEDRLRQLRGALSPAARQRYEAALDAGLPDAGPAPSQAPPWVHPESKLGAERAASPDAGQAPPSKHVTEDLPDEAGEGRRLATLRALCAAWGNRPPKDFPPDSCKAFK